MYMGTGIGVAIGLPYFPGAAGGAGGGGMLDSELNGLSFKASNDFMEIKDTTTPANNYRGSASAKFGNSRASQALYYNSDDLLVWSPENTLTFSEDMAGTDWSNGGVTVTPNAIAAPNGTMTADLVSDTGGTSGMIYRMPTFVVGQRYTASIYVKAGTSNIFSMGGNGDVMSPFWAFELTGAGSTRSLNVGIEPGVATIFAMANGWYRCSVSFTFLGGMMFLIYAPAFMATLGGDVAGEPAVTGGVYYWGAQLERSSTTGKYIPTTSSPGYGIRLDYDARLGVNKPGYLSEKEKTNYILSSRDLSNATYWNASGTIVANQAASAMGDQTIAKWTTVGLSDDRLMQTNASAANATGKVWIISFWAKCETGTFNLPVLVDSADSVVFINTTVPLTTTLKRFYVTGTAGTIATTALRVLFGGFNSMTASPSVVLYIGDVQAEQIDIAASYIGGPSSYIPTTTATVTRAGDTPHVPTSQFPYASQNGTLYAKFFDVMNRGGNALGLNNKEFDYGNYIVLGATGQYPPYGGGGVQAYYLSGMVNNYSVANKPPGVAYKEAFGWAPNNNNMAFAGLMASVDDTNDPTYPVLNELAIGYSVIYLNQMDGWVLEGMYLPRRMTNSQLQVQTGGLPILTAAETLLGSETSGLALSAFDDSLVIKNPSAPANNYLGSAVSKFGAVRASAGTKYGPTGLLELAPANWARHVTLYSPDNVTVTANATLAPDGTMTGAKLAELGTTAPHHAYQSTGMPLSGTYTYSIYMKAAERTRGVVWWQSGGNYGVNVNLITGALGTVTGPVTAASENAGNGWFRISITGSFTAGSAIVMAVADSDGAPSAIYAGTAGSGIYVWGAQIEPGPIMGPYLLTNNTVPVGGLRIDYNPAVAGAKFLMEEQRTNTAPYSGNLSLGMSIYVGSGTWSSATAPDGTTANCLLTTTSPTNGYTGGLFSTTAVPYTASIYAKAGTVSSILVGFAGSFVGSTFNLSTGTVTSDASGHVGRITPVGGGWYRCEATVTPSGNSSIIVNVNGTGTVYLWGWQAEVGAKASSYIPTTSAATVTRAQDSPRFPYAASPTAGTLYAKYAAYMDGMGNVWSVSDTPAVGGISDTINIMAPNPYKFYIWADGGPQVNQEGVVTLNAIHKHAAGWVTGNANSAIDGSILGADVVTTNSPDFVPYGSYLQMGDWAYGGYNFNGWLYEGMYLPRRMTNAELVTRSTP